MKKTKSKKKKGYTLIEQAMAVALVLLLTVSVQSLIKVINKGVSDNYINTRLYFETFGNTQKYRYYTTGMIGSSITEVNPDTSTSMVYNTQIVTTFTAPNGKVYTYTMPFTHN